MTKPPTCKKCSAKNCKWLGLKMLRKGYALTPYHRRGRDGEHIPLHTRAQEAANYLANTQWGDSMKDRGQLPEEMVITQTAPIKITDIEIEEVEAAIKKLKNYKCEGPDGTTTELFKALDQENVQTLTDALNVWWSEEVLEPEALQARVVHIYKKCCTSNLANS